MKPTRYPGIFMIAANKYRIRARVIEPKTGKLKEVDRTRTCTLKEAVALQVAWRDEAKVGATATTRVHLRDYARSWLDTRLPRLKASTAQRYAEILDDHILPEFGDYYLDALAPSDVAKWLGEQSRTYREGTVAHFLRVLRVMTRDAMADFDLPRDPCARVKAPRRRVFTDENPNLLTADQLRRLIDAVRTTEPEWYCLTATLAFTGLRWGEATALRWSDIDEAAMLIRVRRAQWHGMISETKTGQGRSVPLVPELVEILRAHRRSLVTEQRKGLELDWIFPSRVGKLYQPGVLRLPLRRALRAAGLPIITVHGLRRTFNNLARQVTSGEVVRAITGHVTVAMTEHYSHIAATEKQAAAAGVMRLLAGGGGSGGGSREGDSGESEKPE